LQIEPRSKLLVIGEPCENYGRYEAIKRKEKIEDHVFERLDYIPNDEVSTYFFAADVVVLPYNEITQSGVLQIAYAFGRPVVATELPGFKEAIENGKNGFLVPLNDVDTFAGRVGEILQNHSKTQEMGAYSKFLCDTQYSWDGIAARTIEVYTKLEAR
jgi:glycosyltransferase involved in cell wall biosynthesis